MLYPETKKKNKRNTKISIRISKSFRAFGLIFPIFLKTISFEKFSRKSILTFYYNLIHFYINFLAKDLSKYIKNKISNTDMKIKIFKLF